MKTILFIFYFILLTQFSFSQYFVPFGADSLWCDNPLHDSVYSSSVFTLKVIDTNLFVGSSGIMELGGTDTLGGVGYWNGQWNSMSKGNYPEDGFGSVYDFIKYNNCIYVAHNHGHIGLPNTAYLTGWDGTQWLQNPEELNSGVFALAVRNDTLFFGGGFHGTDVEPTGHMYVGGFNGSEFIKLGHLPSSCYGMATYNGEVYAGGTWGTLKKYIGGTGYSAWEDVVSHDGYIKEMQVDTFNNFLYLVNVESIDTMPANGIAVYDGFTFSSMGAEIGYIEDFAEYRGEIYARDGNNMFKKWDDINKTWIENPLNINMYVYDMVVYDNMLYIGGINYDTQYWGCMDSTDYGICRYFIPEDSISACAYLKPRVQSYTDTFNVNQTAQFYNNNAYADTWSWDFGDTGTANIKDPIHEFTQVGNYTVSVTVTHGTCTKTATKDITVILGAGIKETQQKESGFKIYPNPSKNILFLEITNDKLRITNKTVQIIDINGKAVKKLPIKKGAGGIFSIDISHLQNGTYFIKIGGETQQFVKE